MTSNTLSLTAKPQIRIIIWLRNVVLALLMVITIFVISGLTYQSLYTSIDARDYPVPGQLIEIDNYKMHLYCMGEPRKDVPTVILVASYPATVSSWVWIQSQIASVTRVCAYDRAGEGWSDPSSEVPTIGQMADDLYALLEKSGEPGPYLLVGHSFGGAVTRLFTVQYPELVRGLVWIESLHPDTWVRQGLTESTLGGMAPEQVAGIPVLARLGVFRVFPALRGPWGIVPGLPEQQQAELLAYFNTSKWADHIVAVEKIFPESLNRLRQAGDVSNIPLSIVIGSASENAGGVGLELQRELETLSIDSQEYWVEGADHSSLVHQEEYAQQTAQIILEMINKVK